MATRFITAKELVTLNRGKERIVFNAEFVNPVYFPRGGDEALEILGRIKALDIDKKEEAALRLWSEFFLLLYEPSGN